MVGPSITDWLQGGGTVAALVLSTGALIWQALERAGRRRRRIRVVATEENDKFWTVLLSVTELEQHARAHVKVNIVSYDGASLFDLRDLGHLGGVGGASGDEPRYDFAQFTDDLGVEHLHLALEHVVAEGAPDSTAITRFGVHSPGVTVELRIKVGVFGQLRPLLRRTLSLSPVR